MARVAEMIVLLNAVGGIVTFMSARFVRNRRRTNVERVRQLERENAEMDERLARMVGR